MPRLTAPRRQAEVCAPLPAAHAAARYARHLPERTLLYALVQAHYPDFIARLEAEDRPLPEYVREEFETYLRCGVLEHGFLRVVCEQCRAERLVAFSCKKRGFCPSCGARRMAESARHLVEEVFGPRPVRQWVLSFPYPLRFLFASKPEAIGPVLGIVHRVIAGWLADQAGVDHASAQCGAVTLIQRFGSALNLNVHFHMLWLDGVYEDTTERPQRKPRLHLADAEGGSGNHRNGRSGKTVLTDEGPLRIDVPRDRTGTFEPQLIPKHERRFAGFDDRIVSMYARGMTVREIQGHLAEMYSVEVSPEFISKVTDEVMAEVTAWQARPLEAMYPVVFFDALRVKIREDGVVRNKAVYLALGVLATAPATSSGCGSRTPRARSSG